MYLSPLYQTVIAFLISLAIAAPYPLPQLVRRSEALQDWPLYKTYSDYVEAHCQTKLDIRSSHHAVLKGIKLDQEDIKSKKISLTAEEACHTDSWYFHGASDDSIETIEQNPQGKIAIMGKKDQGSYGTILDGILYTSDQSPMDVAVKIQEEDQPYGAILQSIAFDFVKNKHPLNQHVLGVEGYFEVEESGQRHSALIMPLANGDLRYLESISSLNRILAGRQILEGLVEMQNADIVSFDIKSANLVYKNGVGNPLIQFIDFDEGVDLSVNTDSTKFPITGTEGYIAPEMIVRARSPATSTFDGKLADLWSTGMVLLEMFFYYQPPTTRRPYFENEEEVVKLWRSLVQTPEEQKKPNGRVGLEHEEVRDALDNFFGDRMHGIMKRFFTHILCKEDERWPAQKILTYYKELARKPEYFPILL